MKRLFAVLTLCASTLIAASAVSSPAAADGRHDGRHGGQRHAGQFERQTSQLFKDRGEQRHGFRDHRDRRNYKFRRHHKRPRYGHRHAHPFKRWPGYGYGRPRHQRGYRTGSAYTFRFDGARLVFRFD